MAKLTACPKCDGPAKHVGDHAHCSLCGPQQIVEAPPIQIDLSSEAVADAAPHVRFRLTTGTIVGLAIALCVTALLFLVWRSGGVVASLDAEKRFVVSHLADELGSNDWNVKEWGAKRDGVFLFLDYRVASINPDRGYVHRSLEEFYPTTAHAHEAVRKIKRGYLFLSADTPVIVNGANLRLKYEVKTGDGWSSFDSDFWVVNGETIRQSPHIESKIDELKQASQSHAQTNVGDPLIDNYPEELGESIEDLFGPTDDVESPTNLRETRSRPSQTNNEHSEQSIASPLGEIVVSGLPEQIVEANPDSTTDMVYSAMPTDDGYLVTIRNTSIGDCDVNVETGPDSLGGVYLTRIGADPEKFDISDISKPQVVVKWSNEGVTSVTWNGQNVPAAGTRKQ